LAAQKCGLQVIWDPITEHLHNPLILIFRLSPADTLGRERHNAGAAVSLRSVPDIHTGAGVRAAAGQLAGMLGVPGGASGTIDKGFDGTPVACTGEYSNPHRVGLGPGGHCRLAHGRPAAPGALIATVGSIVANRVSDLRTAGSGLLHVIGQAGARPTLSACK
jgi:hypothetical protein